MKPSSCILPAILALQAWSQMFSQDSGDTVPGIRNAPATTASASRHPGGVRSLFLTDSSPQFDTHCLFRKDGPIVFDIAVPEYAGEVNSEGYLKHARDLAAAGCISSTATLRLLSWDVDWEILPVRGLPEIDKVFLNGNYVGNLTGGDQLWSEVAFTVPVQFIRFAAQDNGGRTLEPGLNRVLVQIDTGNREELWCVSVDRVSLEVQRRTEAGDNCRFMQGTPQSGGRDRQGRSPMDGGFQTTTNQRPH